MSYILDALKRAHAERERGTVPGLHAQPSLGTYTAAPKRGPKLPLVLAASGAIAVIVIALAWRAMSGVDTAPPPAAATRVVTAPVAAAPVPGIDRKPPTVAATGERGTPRRRVSDATAAAPPPAAVGTPVLFPEPGPSTARTASAPTAVVAMRDLPEALRQQLPPVKISGVTYSGNPAHRMLIANGDVFHEGGKVAPELVLEQIGRQQAIFSFRGQRYAVPY